MTEYSKANDGSVFLTTSLSSEVAAKLNLPALVKLFTDMASGAPVLVILADLQAVFASDSANYVADIGPEFVANFSLPALMKLLSDLSKDQPLSVIIADVIAIFSGNVVPPVLAH